MSLSSDNIGLTMPVQPANTNNGNGFGFGGDGSWWIIVLFLFIFCGWGGNWGGNRAVPTGGTVGPISVALAVGGESLTSATAIVTPAAVENYFNVFVAAFIEVPRGCCVTVAVKNTSTQAVSIANSNLIVERVA